MGGGGVWWAKCLGEDRFKGYVFTDWLIGAFYWYSVFLHVTGYNQHSRNILVFRFLKTMWVRKYLNTTNNGKWKLLLDLKLRNYGSTDIFHGYLNVSDTKKVIKVTNLFFKELLDY